MKLCMKKLQNIKNEVLLDTYSKEAVQALRNLRLLIDKAIQEAQEEIEKASLKICYYEQIGPSFDKLVQEYLRILQEIRNKEWVLSQLHTTV